MSEQQLEVWVWLAFTLSLPNVVNIEKVMGYFRFQLLFFFLRFLIVIEIIPVVVVLYANDDSWHEMLPVTSAYLRDVQMLSHATELVFIRLIYLKWSGVHVYTIMLFNLLQYSIRVYEIGK